MAGEEGREMPEEKREFTVPDRWKVEEASGVPTLVGPEGDLRITFVEVESEGSPQDSALTAWRKIEPEFGSTVRMAVAVPAPDGWDEMHQVMYEVPPSEERLELAVVRKLRGRMFVNLVRGTTAGVSRRGAQLTEALTSWKPAGYRETDLTGKAANPWTERESSATRRFLGTAMEALQVPGVAMAVVQGGKVVWAEGFGVRGLGQEGAVTPRTRFMIGSSTKPLTTLMMAKLIDQGKVEWKTRVCDLLPGFALADPELTARLELLHTASASTGMPRQDMEFIFRYSGITAEQRMEQMRSMTPTTGFGETFQYSNLLVAAGGYAAARAFTGDASLSEAYERGLRALVTEPLGMADTVLRQEEAVRGEAAMPHAMDFAGRATQIPLSLEGSVESVAPAGGAWSTVLDLARYLMLELGNGRMPDGERVIGEATLLERRKKGIKIDEKSSYGLGLFVSEEAGLQVIHHGGNTLGFSADLFFVPERELGVVVLTNASGAVAFLKAVRQKVFELVLGAEAKAENTVEMAAKMNAQAIAVLQRQVTTDPAAMEWVGELAGRYTCAELGNARLEKREDGYRMEFDEWGSEVGSEVRDGGDRLLRLVSPPWRGGLSLLADAAGQKLLLDGAQKKYVFERGEF
jgi:CubicO group peptidase (beta-lactamase class C family)